MTNLGFGSPNGTSFESFACSSIKYKRRAKRLSVFDALIAGNLFKGSL